MHDIGKCPFVIFAILFLTAGDSLAKALIVCNVEIQTETIKKTQIEMNLLAEQMKKSGQQDKKKLKQGKVLKKKQDEARKQLEILKKGKISVLDIIPLAGYRMIQILDWDGTSDVVKKLNQKCIQFKEKKKQLIIHIICSHRSWEIFYSVQLCCSSEWVLVLPCRWEPEVSSSG